MNDIIPAIVYKKKKKAYDRFFQEINKIKSHRVVILTDLTEFNYLKNHRMKDLCSIYENFGKIDAIVETTQYNTEKDITEDIKPLFLFHSLYKTLEYLPTKFIDADDKILLIKNLDGFMFFNETEPWHEVTGYIDKFESHILKTMKKLI